MNPGDNLIEAQLRRGVANWRWLRLAQYSATLGAAVCAGVLGLGLVMLLGWITQPSTARVLVFLLAAIAFLTWLVLIVVVVDRTPPRAWLAGIIETGSPQLQDRLNTLVYLQAKPSHRFWGSIYQHIAVQTRRILSEKPPSMPIPVRPVARPFLVFLLLLGVCAWIYQRYSPWQRLLAAHQNRTELNQQAAVQATNEFSLPDQTVEESSRPWGEVRITEPGRDLRVTKVDVVPLQIEAAANEPIQRVGWLTAVNGAQEIPHPLPAAADPRYAVYQPVLYLDEWRLSDWDVLTYYAKAETTRTNSMASEVYFIEVRPFREDILKLPGGEQGQAYQYLSELTALIDQQQQVIRQTHQQVQKPPDSPLQRDQDREKLATAENDLSTSVRHFQAQMSTTMENQGIGETLDHLAKAEDWLTRAGESLRANTLPEAQNRERGALADLVSARKCFQTAVSDNPQAFAQALEETPPISEKLQSQLKEIAEFRNEAKAAQDMVKQAYEKQRQIAEKAQRMPLQSLAKEEEALCESLSEFMGQHLKAFEEVQVQSGEALQALNLAAQDLKRSQPKAKTEAQQAAEKLKQLQDALQDQNLDHTLADAYKLKKMLDRQIQQLDRVAQQPAAWSTPSLRQLAQQAKDTTSQLKQIADQPAAGEVFGPELKRALSDPQKRELDAKLNAVPQSGVSPMKQMAARSAKAGLQDVAQAFEKSQPASLQAAQQSQSLQSGEADGLEQGLSQLASLLRQLQDQKSVDPRDQAKQMREAMFNLQTGLKNHHGNPAPVQQFLVQMERELLKTNAPVDASVLSQRLQELRNLTIEPLLETARKSESPEAAHLDPARLPPAYRERVERYFQKLSEK